MTGRLATLALCAALAACAPALPAVDVRVEPLPGGTPIQYRATAPAAADVPRWWVESALADEAGRICSGNGITPLPESTMLQDEPQSAPTLVFRCSDATPPGRIRVRVGDTAPEWPALAAGRQRSVAFATGRGVSERDLYQPLLGGMLRDIHVDTCGGSGVTIHRIATAVGPLEGTQMQRADIAIDFTCLAPDA